MIKLGSRVQDTVTKFAGIAVARCENMSGVVEVAVQSQDLNEGYPVSLYWVDEGRVVEVEEVAASPTPTLTPKH